MTALETMEAVIELDEELEVADAEFDPMITLEADDEEADDEEAGDEEADDEEEDDEEEEEGDDDEEDA